MPAIREDTGVAILRVSYVLMNKDCDKGLSAREDFITPPPVVGIPYTYQAGGKAVTEVIANAGDFDALFCADDEIAQAEISPLSSTSIKVGDLCAKFGGAAIHFALNKFDGVPIHLMQVGMPFD